MKNIRASLFKLLIFTSALCGSISPAHASRTPFRPNETTLNVMTVSRVHQKPTMTERDLVQRIYRNRMPLQAIIDIEGTPYLYQKGIASCAQNAEYIYLMSRGYARRKKIAGPHKDDHFIQKGGCVIHTRDRIAQNVVPLSEKSVAITFDYKDDYPNFGQKRDISCLSHVYDAVKKSNPSAHIIIVSECLGAKVALELASRHPLDNTTIVLESPFFKAEELFPMMAANYAGWANASLLKWSLSAFAHYDKAQDDLPNRFKNIAPHIHIFACHRNKDPLLHDDCFETHMKAITNHLTGNHVTCYRFDDTQELHSSTFRWPGCQRAVNEFYKKHGLPYHAHLID